MARPLSGGRPRPRSRATATAGEAIGERTGGAKGAGSASSGLVMAEAKTTVTESSRTRMISLPSQSPLVSNGCRNSRVRSNLAPLDATRHRAG